MKAPDKKYDIPFYSMRTEGFEWHEGRAKGKEENGKRCELSEIVL